jgi:CBS domain containing-hemolysin-like protein
MSPYLVDVLKIASVLLLVAINGYFVAVEFALVSVRWTRIEQLVREKKFGAAAVHRALANLDGTIAAAQLGITFASLGLGWIGEPAFAHLIEPLFRGLPGALSFAVTHGIAVVVAYLLLTYMHVVLGEQAPKAIALQYAEQVALIGTGPLVTFANVFRPFIIAIRGSSRFIVRILRIPDPSPTQEVHSVDELRMLVEETQEAGAIPEDQASYVQNVFRLSDKRVRDVMVPREKVVTLSIDAKEEEILETARRTAHTRMPVWDGSPDNIVGIVNTKNLFHLFSLKGIVILMDAMYPPILVHPDQAVSRLLRIFRRERRPMAVVRDQDGKFLGVVTLEDILEEIVGEIEDEHDAPRPPGAIPGAAPIPGPAPSPAPIASPPRPVP